MAPKPVYTKAEVMGKPFEAGRPHVVILGAGASRAAFPRGDRNGKLVPLMAELPIIIGKAWTDLLITAQPDGDNFEIQFSNIQKIGKFNVEISFIKRIIDDYFDSLELPDYPTLYDFLVLGLRSKDVIGTFNWDPFLVQAIKRNRNVCNLPEVRFLHGCRAFATCEAHDIFGLPGETCPNCESMLKQGRLFYPDEDKNYTIDVVINREWNALLEALATSFHLTIFGYSGPRSDYNARLLLLTGWMGSRLHSFSHVEIIDIAEPSVLVRNWAEFIPFDHDMVKSDFMESTIAQWPRRTEEYKMSASRDAAICEVIGPPSGKTLADLQSWFKLIAENE